MPAINAVSLNLSPAQAETMEPEPGKMMLRTRHTIARVLSSFTTAFLQRLTNCYFHVISISLNSVCFFSSSSLLSVAQNNFCSVSISSLSKSSVLNMCKPSCYLSLEPYEMLELIECLQTAYGLIFTLSSGFDFFAKI